MADAAERPDAPEPPGVRSRIVAAAVLGTFATVAVAVTLLWLVYQGAIGPDLAIKPAAFPAPRLDPDEPAHRRQDQDVMRRRLASYGWVDRKAGLVRIPIDEAMAMIVARGDAALDPLPDAGAAPPKPRGGGQ